MTQSLFATVPITLVKRVITGQDALGNDVLTNTTVGVLNGVFYPQGSSEQVQGQDQVITQPEVFLPVADLSAVDALSIAGTLYEVDGDPFIWPPAPFTGWLPPLPMQVRLRRVTG